MKRWSLCLLVLVLAGCGGSAKKTTTPVPAAPTPAKDAAPWPAPADPMKLAEQAGLTPATYVQATPDLLMGDLLKNMRSSQIFSVCGLPEIEIRKVKH